MASPIPMSPDVAELIGSYAERTDNRSLLLDKFVFPKQWVNGDLKQDEATRWSLLRLTKNGISVLQSDLNRAQFKLKKGGNPNVIEKAKTITEVLPKISQTASPPKDIYEIREKHSRRMLELFTLNDNAEAIWFTARLESRLAINLAEGLVQNAGICLDRLFGMPYIPGSALKGNARHAALDSLEENDSLFVDLFGNTEQKGAVSFINAYPVDGLDEDILEVDITNVHTPTYYSGKDAGDPKQLRSERPRPNPFPVVRKGIVFAFVISLNSVGKRHSEANKLLEKTKHYLKVALTENGIGAKTSSGYGWFSLTPEVDEKIKAQAEQDAQVKKVKVEAEKQKVEEAKKETDRLAAMSPIDREFEIFQQMEPQFFAAFVLEAEEKSSDQQLALLRILKTPEKKDLLKKYRKGKKAADANRWSIVSALAQKNGIDL